MDQLEQQLPNLTFEVPKASLAATKSLLKKSFAFDDIWGKLWTKEWVLTLSWDGGFSSWRVKGWKIGLVVMSRGLGPLRLYRSFQMLTPPPLEYLKFGRPLTRGHPAHMNYRNWRLRLHMLILSHAMCFIIYMLEILFHMYITTIC